MEDYNKEIKNQNENEIEEINQKAEEVEEAEKEQEINEEQERLKAERAEFDMEDGIEFQEIIRKEDALNFNYYLQKNSSNFSRRLFSCLLGVLMIWYVLNIKQYYGLILLGLGILAYAIFLYVPIQKRLTKRMFEKKGFQDLTVNVKFASKIKYELDSETISPLVPYETIKCAVKTEKYIYLHLGPYSVIIIKLEDLGEKREEVIEFIRNKFEPINKFKEKLK